MLNSATPSCPETMAKQFDFFSHKNGGNTMKKTTVATPITFKDIAQYCKPYIKGLNLKTLKYSQILGLPPIPTNKNKFLHFEILGDDKKRILYVEFHIEGNNGTGTLLTFIKYWKGISVFDKKIQYDSKWLKKWRRIYIKCNYSLGKEKICAYIYEFVYQINSRIQNLITIGGLQ